MKIYISGCISKGGELSEKEILENINKFKSAEVQLTELGYEVVSPISMPYDPKRTWESYMLGAIELLFPCSAIFMLNNYEDSLGAQIELAISQLMDKMVFDEREPEVIGFLKSYLLEEKAVGKEL